MTMVRWCYARHGCRWCNLKQGKILYSYADNIVYLTANKRRNRRRFILFHLKDPSELYENVYDESRDDVSAKWNKRT